MFFQCDDVLQVVIISECVNKAARQSNVVIVICSGSRWWCGIWFYHYALLVHIAAHCARCGLLLQTEWRGLSLCLYVSHNCEQ